MNVYMFTYKMCELIFILFLMYWSYSLGRYYEKCYPLKIEKEKSK